MNSTRLAGQIVRLAATAAVLATTGLAAAQAADASKGKKVLIVQSLIAHPYVAATTKAFRERAESHGMEITVLAAGFDAALQARQFDDGVARKFDLIVTAPISEQGIVPSLARAKQAGIPVVIVNNPVKEGAEEYYVSYVGQDQHEQGRIAGRAMLAALKASGRDGGKIALITGLLSQGIGPRRLAGIKEILDKEPKVQIVATEDGRWDTATSERIAGQLFARFAATGGIDLLYGMADNQAVAGIKAAEAAGISVGLGPKQLAVIGGTCLKEGIDAIENGKLYATQSQIPTDLGRATADVVDSFFNGKTPKKFEWQPVEVITKTNVAQWKAACTY